MLDLHTRAFPKNLAVKESKLKCSEPIVQRYRNTSKVLGIGAQKVLKYIVIVTS